MHEILKLSRHHAAKIDKLSKAYHSALIHRGGAETPEKTAARAAFGEGSAKLAKRLFGLSLTPEEAFRAVQYQGNIHKPERSIRNPGTFEQRLDLLRSTLRGKTIPTEDHTVSYDHNYEYILPAHLFHTLYFYHDYTTAGPRAVGTIECGGGKVKDTPRALYRLLFLTRRQSYRAPFPIDFSDMYKTGEFLCLTSPDGRFCAHAELWKYELALRWSATREHITGQRHGITCGIPTADNGVKSACPLLQKWTSTLILALNTKWDVYSGNNFTV